MTQQEILVSFLKKKGTGQTMGKSLLPDELATLSNLLLDSTVDNVTKATILTAFLTLENTAEEDSWLAQLKDNYVEKTPQACHFLFTPSEDKFENLIHKVIGHTDLKRSQFEWAMSEVLNPKCPETHKAAFLEAERLKRESKVENMACLDVFYRESQHWLVNTHTVVDLSVGYDGFNRTPCIWPFVAMQLGSLGIPTIIHGTKEVAPKKGVTPYKILEKMGINPLMSFIEVQDRLEDPKIRWAYIDQSISFPKLHALNDFRSRMVKRPIIATIEKLLQPMRSINGRNIIITGYTHPPYRQKTIDLLTNKRLYTEGLIIRGQEGSIQLATDRRSPLIKFTKKKVIEGYVRPETYDCLSEKLDPMPHMSLDEHVQWGLDGLSGKNALAEKMIHYLVQVIIDELKVTR